MSDAPVTDSGAASVEQEPRSTGAVLGMLGAIAGLVLVAIIIVYLARGGSSSGTGDDLADQVRSNRIQALYLTDGQVVFGDVESAGGDWIKLVDGYSLRRNAADPAQGAGKDTQPDTTIEVVSIASAVGGDGDRLINGREVLAVENLNTNSPIAQRIEDARK